MLAASAFFAMPADKVSPRLEACFFSGLKTSNRTFKKTDEGRLAALDQALVGQLDVAGARIGAALDLGISSGITTLELVQALQKSGHDVRMTGTDRLLRARLVRLPLGCRALVEPGGHVLQYEVMGLAVRAWRRRLDWLTGMVPARGLLATLARRTLMRRRHSHHAQRVMLVSRRVAENERIELIEDDLTRFNPVLAARFDLVRAANLLNRHVFSDGALARVIDHAIAYLSGPGAWLLVVRTGGAADHDGTLFRMTSDRGLEIAGRYGDGSEVEALVLERAQRGANPARRERWA